MKITLLNDGWNDWRDLATITKAAKQPKAQVIKQIRDLYKQGLIVRTTVTRWKVKTN